MVSQLQYFPIHLPTSTSWGRITSDELMHMLWHPPYSTSSHSEDLSHPSHGGTSKLRWHIFKVQVLRAFPWWSNGWGFGIVTLWLRLLLRLGFDPWPRNFHMQKKKKKKNQVHMGQMEDLGKRCNEPFPSLTTDLRSLGKKRGRGGVRGLEVSVSGPILGLLPSNPLTPQD